MLHTSPTFIPYPIPMHARTDGRKDLADFLRSRRGRVTPAQVGLAQGPRRRTAGLRREELAQLAGIGLTWYTWLEQGRDIAVSARALDGIATALQFDAIERAHLFTLAQRPRADVEPAAQQVTAGVQRVLDAFAGPAYVINGRWDVLAWNADAVTLFGDFDDAGADGRNFLWRVFADPAWRRLFVDWLDDAPLVLAKFRIGYVRGGGESNPAFRSLVHDLKSRSPQFRDWWDQQDVLGRAEGAKRFHVAGIGELELMHSSFNVGSDPDLRLIVYTRVDGRPWARD